MFGFGKNVLHDVTTCIILHNMIIEDECEYNAPTELGRKAPPPDTEIVEDKNVRFRKKLFNLEISKIHKLMFHHENALVDHL